MTKTIQRFFESRPESIGQARTFTTEALTSWGLLDRGEDVRLCVSELATNAMLHGTAPGRGFLVRLDADDEAVRLEVHDSRRLQPHPRRPRDTDTAGRGLLLVTALADGWGVEDRTPFGKIVWSCFKAPRGTTS
ncbi:6-phosphofructokinase [Streptomyces sp. CB02130]|uniref:ATP-binding protein n=1 Tax=Streptomyces sp. CB02130 TaxID=1703934 RepID=UPI00093BBD67|nr:ATP-binding protein [Streptomyces sp. CB02130]OKJ31150.1 6-phosphofructokinase [Streptomyces sp. CB02130]